MRVRFYQEGGPVGGQEQGGQDPMQQLIQMAMQAVQNNDGNMALQVCQILLQMAQGAAQQGGEAEQVETGGGEQTGGGEEQGEPVYRAGGRLVRRIRRNW